MPGFGNNLYPPILASYMPAFVRTTACRIYFSLSNYNNVNEIQNVQIVISNQNNNLSALSSNLYPAGIKIATMQLDSEIKGDDKYYVTIEPTDLRGGNFEINQYYKVQLRFTGVGATTLGGMNQIASWLINNQQYFSEWSTVCLIKGIQKPEINLKGFDLENNNEDDIIFTSEVLDFVGQMYYSENADIEKEALKFFRIKIFIIGKNESVYDSGDVYTNIYNPNEINYELKTLLENGIHYKLIFEYTTTNDYFNSKEYTFTILQNAADALNATVEVEAEEDLGRIKVNVVATVTEPFFGNLTIRRSSSESNFTVWEDVKQVTLTDGEILNYSWYDYTVKSGVWYRYCAQRRNSKGDRGAIVLNRRPVMIVFQDIFLSNDKMQIKVKYNPSISSFQTVISESRTETLGGQYPIIRRNGNLKYKTFPISGLITAFCDEEGLFLNKENIYGTETLINLYQDYNEENQIDEYKDFIYEREFREKIMEFLYDNSIKLFRSTTEGNILVKIMDVSFSPNESLGRMLYTFSATAYEVDECTLTKCEQYGIQVIGDYSSYLKTTFTKIGQIQDDIVANQNIFSLINEKYQNLSTEKYINTLKRLTWVRLDFNSPPYLIKMTSNGDMVKLPSSEKATEDTVLGYIVYINGNVTLISAKGFYELIDEDVEITSISFPYDTNVTIDYIAEFTQTENTSSIFQKMYFYTKVGQLRNKFDIEENAFLQIYQKYLIEATTYKQYLLSLDRVVLEGAPGTVAYVKDSFDNSFFKHIIGPTGILELYDKEAIITGLYFSGVQLYSADERYPSAQAEYSDKYIEDEVRETEYRTVDSTQVQLLSDIKAPVKNGVYTINGQKYIYYRNQWYDFSDDNIVQCPVYVSIDYIYELVRGEYEQ